MWHVLLILTLASGDVQIHHLDRFQFKTKEECIKMAPTIGKYFVKEKVDGTLKLGKARCAETEKVKEQNI